MLAKQFISNLIFFLIANLSCNAETLKFSYYDMLIMESCSLKGQEAKDNELIAVLDAYHATRPYNQSKEEFLENPFYYFDNRLEAIDNLLRVLESKRQTWQIKKLFLQAQNKKKYLSIIPSELTIGPTKKDFISDPLIEKPLKLKESAWPELLDPLHRMSKEMKMLIRKWMISPTPNYFIYLDTIEHELASKFLPQKWQVHYYEADEERCPHKLSFKDGLTYYKGKLFDTTEFKTEKLGAGSGLFVLGLNGEFYANNHIRDTIHHSSEFAGQQVIGAGQITAKQGKIVKIDNKSGHYMPKMQDTLTTLRALKEKIGSVADIEVFAIFVKGAHVIPIRASYNGEELLTTNDNVLPFKAEAGWTPLHIATWRKQVNLVEEALKINHVNTKNDHGLTALHVAINQDALDIIKLLMNKNANPNISCNQSYTPFHIAASKGNIEALKLMYKKSELEFVTREGATALLLAARSNSLEAVNFLVAKGCSCKALDAKGNGLLHYAAGSSTPKILSELLTKDPDSISILNNHKATLLHAAAEQGKWETCQILISKGLDPTECDDMGNTIMHYAAEFGNEEVLEKLLSSEWNWMLEAKNCIGQLPLHLIAKTVIDHHLFIKIAKATNNIDEPDYKGNTPLFYSAESKKLQSMIVLLQEGANTRIQNSSGEYPIHKTITSEVFSTPIILSVSDDCALCDSNNNTPLHLALKNPNATAAHYLLSYASRDVLLQKNNDGLNCQDIAESHKDLSLLEKIVDKIHSNTF